MSVTYTLRWRPASGTDPNPNVWSELTGLTSTSQAVTGLTAGVEYEVEVVAVSGSVSSAAAAGSSWTRCAAPTAPATSDVLAETATVSWSGVSGATSYRVERKAASDPDEVGSWSSVGTTLDGDTTQLVVAGMIEESGYDHRVVAVNSVGDSAPSAGVRLTTLALATGGSITTGTGAAAGYRIHSFTSSGTFTLNAARDVEHLIVGGGGGGGFDGAGGGGGGAVVDSVGAAVARTPGTYPVVVGAGGVAGTQVGAGNRGGQGGTSSVLGTSAAGGGGGGSKESTGGEGAAGGGGGHGSTILAGGTGTVGGGGGAGSGSQFGGGGGGAGAAGAAGTSSGPGAGGAGLASTITGTSATYGGGGGGGRWSGSAAAAGGPGGGGAGGTEVADAVAGTANTGGGGGGGGRAAPLRAPGVGGSGIVVIRYPIAP